MRGVAHPVCDAACQHALYRERGRELAVPRRLGAEILRDGYVYVRVGREHHHADSKGYAPKHLIVAEQILGRRLRRDEEVRRVTGKGHRRDNRPEIIDIVWPEPGTGGFPNRLNVRELARLEREGIIRHGRTLASA